VNMRIFYYPSSKLHQHSRPTDMSGSDPSHEIACDVCAKLDAIFVIAFVTFAIL